jgi:hypothetical protein
MTHIIILAIAFPTIGIMWAISTCLREVVFL